jgi:dephospho-CoA kinase
VRIFGLTGGIASGKSTVSEILRELGAHVLDADEIAREVVAAGSPGLAAVAARFPGVLLPDGTLDRRKLAARIYAEPSERFALNALLHPLIAQRFLEHTERLRASGESRVVYDAALLFENGLERGMDGVILVWIPLELQKARLAARDRLSPEEAEARLAAQEPLDQKRARATWIVDNSGDRESTRAQVETIWRAILARG